MRLAVTEACTNVVRHAYAGSDGTIDVVVRPERRRARGDRRRQRAAASGPSPDTAGPGLGLPLIAALTDSLEVERTAERRQPAGDVLPARPARPGDGARVTAAEPPTQRLDRRRPARRPGAAPRRRHVRRARRPAARPARRRRARRRPRRRARARARRRTRPSTSTLASSTRSLDLCVGPLRAGGGRALVVDAAVPGRRQRDRAARRRARRRDGGRAGVPARPARRTPARIRNRAPGRLGGDGDRVRDRGPPASTATRTWSRSAARSTCSPRPSSSSA